MHDAAEKLFINCTLDLTVYLRWIEPIDDKLLLESHPLSRLGLFISLRKQQGNFRILREVMQ